ncbi:MAG: hypothetical protein ACLPVO_05810 [Desulfomonilaceae bacterium]
MPQFFRLTSLYQAGTHTVNVLPFPSSLLTVIIPYNFSLVLTGPSKPVLQLAVNKKGVLRGTSFDIENKTANPIRGVVEKASQRAVWTFADKDNNAVIMETGIFNLTKDQTGVLAHFGKERTQEWTMVRLKEPSDKENQDAPNVPQ